MDPPRSPSRSRIEGKMSSVSSSRKRAPFGEAAADIGNRHGNAKNNGTGGVESSKRRLEPPSSVFSKASPHHRAPVSSILLNNGVRSKSRSRQRLEAQHQLPSSPQRSTSTAHAQLLPKTDPHTRARVYKAEAYEAKIRMASQEQRIEALEAELEELRFFQRVERGGDADAAAAREKKSKDDTELIEMLAQELETMERDLQAAKQRVGELENDLRAKSESNANAAQLSEKADWEQREAELQRQVARQQKELATAKEDVMQGVTIVRELDGALKKARKEKDDAQSQLRNLQAKMDAFRKDYSEGMDELKGYRVALQSMQNERDEAQSELSTLQDEAAELREMNDELQSALQEGSEQMDQFQRGILEARARENTLATRCEEKTKEADDMKSTIAELTRQVEEQQEEILAKADGMEEMEGMHASAVAKLRQEHSIEVKKWRDNASVLEARWAQEEKKKDDLHRELTVAQSKIEALTAVETNYISEMKTLKGSLEELKQSSMSMSSTDSDGPLDELQMENAKLKAEKDDLLRKLQRGLDIHKKTTMELEEKALELKRVQTNAEAAQANVEDTNTLKKDYAAAVELSISRGKQLQTLEKDLDDTQSQLTKAVQLIKRLEKKHQSAEERLKTEVNSLRNSLRAETVESEATVSALREELPSVALKNGSPRNSPDPPVGHDVRRRQIENDALKDYFAQRIQTENERLGYD